MPTIRSGVYISVIFAVWNGLCNDLPLKGVKFRREVEKMTSKRIVVLYSLERGTGKRISAGRMIYITKVLENSTN